MAEKNPEVHEGETGLKMRALTSFIEAVGLDITRDGRKIAVLIEHLVEKYPDQWETELAKIQQEALRRKQEVSLQDAMFYLGDIIYSIDTALIGRTVPRRQRAQALEIAANMQKGIRIHWQPQDNFIAGSVRGESEPDWWRTNKPESKLDDPEILAITARIRGQAGN